MNTKKYNWAGLQIDDYYKNTVENLCMELIQRLSNPKDVIPNGDVSLSSGSSGIIILLNEINKVLGINTDELIHKYIQYSNDNLYNYLKDFSLYSGITGFNYAVSLVNNDTGNYSKLIQSLDDLFIKNFTPVLNNMLTNNTNTDFTPKFDFEFDLISGLSGISRYIISRKNKNKEMESLLCKVSSYFVNLCTDKILNGESVKGWITKKVDFDDNNNIHYTDINEYNLGIAHGVPGVLAILSILTINNIEVPGQKKAIENIQNWLLDINKYIKDGMWPCYIYQDDIYGYKLSHYKRIAWCYGNPGISTALLLSSKALNNKSIHQFSNKILENIYTIPDKQWVISSPMICHGYAGILQIILRSHNKELIYNNADTLIKKLLCNIDFKQKFCFFNNDMNKYYDTPGFLMGASGIALVLLSSISSTPPNWDQLLLLS